jgi:hypothetical protein
MEQKKRSVGAAERDEWLRAAWKVTLAQQIDLQRLVFVDEMGAHTSLSAIYAYSPKGQRAYCSVPRNRGPNTTLLSCMSVKGMGASLVVEGATNREVFEAYVERVLAPGLRPAQVVVMDNLTAHKGERVREPITKGEAASSSRLPATIPSPESSIRSKRLLPRSRASYGKPKLAAARH